MRHQETPSFTKSTNLTVGACAQGYTVVDFFEAIQRKVDEERRNTAS